MLKNSTIELKDGTVLYYKDWGPVTGQPILFSHGWPLSSDAFEDQMLALSSAGYRTIAHDRRGHGRSSQPWEGHNMDRYADDLAELMEALNVHNAVLIGHSTGGGEVARYIARHGISRVAKTVLISSVPPIMLKTDFNPEGSPVSVFDDIREGVINDRSHYFKELPDSFYGFNRPNATPSEGLRDGFWRQGMMGSIKALHDCIKVFSETDQREDLKKMTVPTLVLYGTDDQIVPPAPSSEAAAKLLPNPTVKSYPGASHGLCSTHKFEINQDLLKFIKDGTV